MDRNEITAKFGLPDRTVNTGSGGQLLRRLSVSPVMHATGFSLRESGACLEFVPTASLTN